MTQEKGKPAMGFSVKVSSTLFLLIPIINISFLMTANHEGILGPSGTMTFAGIGLFGGLCFLIVLTSLVYVKNSILFKTLLSLTCIIIPVIFSIIDTRNFVLQTVIITISLFFLLYFLYYDDPPLNNRTRFAQALIKHNGMLLALIVLSTKFSLLTIAWNRYSILVYLVLYGLFHLYCEIKILEEKNHRKLTAVFVAFLIVIVTFFISVSLYYLLVFFFLLFLLFKPFHELKYDKLLLNLLFENPYKLLISSFAFIVIIGSFLLSMPFASSSGESIPFIDSLFTASSAVCVTGLVVLDTYKDFSLAGQGIILFLIQAGGLGIITIMTFISVLLGQSIGVTREYIVGEIVGSKRPKLVYELIRFIILITLAVELTGAALLSFGFYLQEGNWGLSLWKGLFHAISAFCNAGFALQSDSLVPYNQTYLIPLTISFLIIIGGLGFPVISFIYELLTGKTDARRMPILVKLSLIITSILLIAGYLVFLLGEYNNSFAGLPAGFKHLNAFVLSASSRTAGFNSTDMNQLAAGSVLFLWILMFVGAGSCSTAGGIKITTLGVLFAAIDSLIKGRAKTILFEKRLPSMLVNRALVLFITSISLVLFVAMILLISQNLSLTETLFESISAFGTVGLSLGATAKLDDFGKFLIVILMFIGRVNILTFISLFITTKVSAVRYPEESMMIG